MDSELVAYLDRRFDELISTFEGRFTQIDGRFSQIDGRFTQIDARFAQIDARFSQIDDRFSQIDGRFEQTDGRFDEMVAEMKRHFDVVAESLMAKIQLVGEGVRTVDNKLDRFSAETRDEFRKVDRRLLHLTARVSRER